MIRIQGEGTSIDIEKALKSHTIYDFEEFYTRRLFKFDSVE